MFSLIIAFFFYFLLLFFILYGIIKFKPQKNYLSDKHGISIIIAIRNGEKSLINIINDLKKQDYRGKMEFILVDDQSTDSTKEIILNTAIQDTRFKYYSSLYGSKDLKNKKRALDIGISNATYNYLLFTDVDCSVPSSWVSTMCSYFNSGYDYLVGSSFTKYDKNSNYVSKFQRTDFLLLMIVCRALSFFGYPLASSGQNQGFTKTLYMKVGGFYKITSFIGDDTAFLQYCNKKGAKSCFVDNPTAQVISRQEFKIHKLLLQRSRWVSDANKIWKINKFFFIMLISIFTFYLSLAICFFIFDINTYLIISILFFKISLEYFLFFLGANFFSIQLYFSHFIVWEIFYIPYVIIVGIMSYLTRFFRWKGRRLI